MTLPRWRKSSYSDNGPQTCVELAHTLSAVRDSKNVNGPTLSVNAGALVAAIKSGRIG